MRANIYYHDAAILVWLAPGQIPDTENLAQSNLTTPPTPNPEPWWNARDAIIYAFEWSPAMRHGKVPWIKYGHELLSPYEINRVYSELKPR
jgi:hypothetical protein